MSQELNEANFIEARGFVANADSGAELLVCDEYELRIDAARTGKNGELAYYVYPKHPARFRYGMPLLDECRWHRYEPLEENPDLFFKFAGLQREERSPSTALEWANDHAPLSCNLGFRLNRNEFKPTGVDPCEYVDDFFEEVDRAATVLKLYEAALKRDRTAVTEIILEGPSPFVREYYVSIWEADPEQEDHNNDMLVFGMFVLMLEVSRMVRTYAYQQLHIPSELPLISRVRQGWGFDSLLGAMYLQMYWLLAAGGKNVTYCKYCGKLISLTTRTTKPNKPSKTRKTRQDRQYCDNRCQQRHYYHSTEKFRRKAKRSAG